MSLANVFVVVILTFALVWLLWFLYYFLRELGEAIWFTVFPLADPTGPNHYA